MFRQRPHREGSAKLQRAAESLTESAGIRAGSTLNEILEAASLAHKKPILLTPVADNELRTLTGLWAETEECSYVFYRERDTPIYRLHSVFHELGHILADHRGCGALAHVDHKSLPSLGLGQQIRRARGRSSLDSPEELFAEEMAYTLSWSVFAGMTLGLPTAFA